jgi:hypothetical protein
MACETSNIAVARETKLLMGLESTCGVQVAPTNGGMQLVLLREAGSVSQAIRHIDDPQYRNTRSRLLPIVGSYDAGAWNFPTLIKAVSGSGTPVKPEIDTLLQCLMGQAYESDTTWFGSVASRVYKLLGVSPGGTIYPSFTAWFQVGHTVWYICGATANQGEFEVVGNELARATFSGQFMRHGWCGTSIIQGTGSGTAITVDDASRYMLADPDNDRVYVQILHADGTLSGSASVTEVNYSSNVLTLGGSLSWNDGDKLVPYLPAGTEYGVPLYGKYGLVKIGEFVDKTFGNLPSGTQVVQSGRVTITNGIVYHADLKDGTQYPTEYVVPAFREVEGELALFFYPNVMSFQKKAQDDPLAPDYVILPAQDKDGNEGKIVEIHIPRAIWSTPGIAGDAEKTATLAFKAVATTDYDDELAIVYRGG